MSKRPIREKIEETTPSVPKGPLGFLGGGNAVGALGYFSSAAASGIVPLDGVRFGANIRDHDTETRNGVEKHTFEINAANRDTAKFMARYNSSASTVDALLQKKEVDEIEPIIERSTYTTWRVVTTVEE